MRHPSEVCRATSKVATAGAISAVCFALAVALPGPPAAAQQRADVPADPGTVLTDAVAKWSIEEFVQQAVLRNATAQAVRLQSEAAGRLVEAERALYDPTLVSGARRELSNKPRTFEEQTSGLTNVGKDSAIEQYSTASAGLRGKLPSGATFEFSQDLRRRASNLLANGDVREHRGTLTLTLRQPLLKGAGRASTEADLRVAEKEHQIEAQRFIKQVLDVVTDAGSTYWQSFRAEQTLRMRERAVAVAQELRAEVQRRADGGMAPRVELMEADIALAARQADVVRARQLAVEVQARARNLLAFDPVTHPAWVLVTSVTEAASEPATAVPDTAGGPPEAMLGRVPAYQIASLRLEQEQIRLDHARRQERADLSLEFGLNRSSLTDSWRSGLEQSLGSRHPGHYMGVLLEMPIDNGAARARREGQGLRRDAARLQADAEAKNAYNEWASRRGQWTASLEEVALLKNEVQARQALLAAERENYATGRTRLRGLIEAQDRLDEGRLRQMDAAVRARVAEIALRASSGELFSFFGLKIAE
ncbi:MAG: TolC family protein [Betaproteobacteria bacterium]